MKQQDAKFRPLASLRGLTRSIPGVVPFVRLVRAWMNPTQRALRLLPRASAKWLMQPAPDTKPDRYPQIFSFVQDALREASEPNLLSYGCSVGEEVFSLRRYFPAATISGVDINAHSIGLARQRLALAPDVGLDFQCLPSPRDLPTGAYDAIFCMAVLRHGDLQADQPARCDDILPFAAAEAVANELARCVRPGGYLCLWYCHFPFSHMAAAKDFDAVLTLPAGAGENQPLYGPDNRRIDGAPLTQAVFRKHLAIP
jgi:SAM-dependent methyltransferase